MTAAERDVGIRFFPIHKPFPQAVHDEIHHKYDDESIFSGRRAVEGITFAGTSLQGVGCAFWLERGKNKGYTLHVSAVEAPVRIPFGSQVDIEASTRALYGYPGGRLVPNHLSDSVLSFIVGERRPAITISIPIDENLGIGIPTIEQTALTNQNQFTFEDIDQIVGNEQDSLHNLIGEYFKLAQRLHQRRKETGALVFFDPQSKIDTTDDGFIFNTETTTAYMSHLIAKEFLFLANQAVANYFVEQGIAGIFTNQLAKEGGLTKEAILAGMMRAAQSPQRSDLFNFISEQSTILNHSYVTAKSEGHFALQIPHYLRWTSPSTRYSDLINQRMMIAYLRGEGLPYTESQLQQIATHINEVGELKRNQRKSAGRQELMRQTNIAISEGTLPKLSHDDLARLIIIVSTQGGMSPGVETVISNKINAGGLDNRQAYWILLGSHVEPQKWIKIKGEAIEWLKKNPGLAISIIKSAVGRLGWPELEFTTESAPQEKGFIYNTSAHLTLTEGRLSSIAKSNTSLKRSQKLAAADLLLKILEARKRQNKDENH